MALVFNNTLRGTINGIVRSGGDLTKELTDINGLGGWKLGLVVVGGLVVLLLVLVTLAHFCPAAVHRAGAFLRAVGACVDSLRGNTPAPQPPPAPTPPPRNPVPVDQVARERARWVAGRAVSEDVHLYSIPTTGTMV